MFDPVIYAPYVVIFLVVSFMLTVCYRSRQENNARAFDKRINAKLLRIKNQHERAQRMIENAENVQGLNDEEIIERAGDWALFSVWTPARAIHLCRFVRGQLYQIDKSFWVAKLTYLVMYSAVFAGIFASLEGGPARIGLLIGYVMSMMFFLLFIRPMKLVKENIDENEWDEYASLRVHDTLRDIVRTEKKKFLTERGRYRSKN